jgi:hypothetical protein
MPATLANAPSPVSQALETALMELEERHTRLCEELAEVEARLRQLRTAADVCPLCGGLEERWVRGGLYGELQRRPCPCRES